MVALVKRRTSPQDRVMDAIAESVEDLAGRFRDGIGTIPLVRRARLGRILWSIGSTLATAAISKKLRDEPVRTDSPSERREPEQGKFIARASSRGED
jgi:hypothetical protein